MDASKDRFIPSVWLRVSVGHVLSSVRCVEFGATAVTLGHMVTQVKVSFVQFTLWTSVVYRLQKSSKGMKPRVKGFNTISNFLQGTDEEQILKH